MSDAVHGGYELYEPINILKPLDENIWVVDGPIIRMSFPVGSLPFPTRMTIIRMHNGLLWVHSPIAPNEELFKAIDNLGDVGWLIAPNSIHYWYMADWQDRYPRAQSWSVPGLAKSAKRPFRIDRDLSLDDADWDGEIDRSYFSGTTVSECAFYHVTSRTVILADLIENFERSRLHSIPFKLFGRLAGVMSPHGSTPRDMRMTYWPQMAEVRNAGIKLRSWQCKRVIMAHGAIIEDNAKQALANGLAWTE